MAQAAYSATLTPAEDSASTLNSDAVLTYIQIARDFIGRCETIQVQGIHKLKKKCQSELKFLQSVSLIFIHYCLSFID